MIALAIDAILALVILEGVALVAYWRATGRGLAPRRILGTLAAGFFLLLGIRFALAPYGDGPIAACLLASLIAHLADLKIRWGQSRGET